MQVKSPDGFMFWYLKSRIFFESVYHFDELCQADMFIDKHLQETSAGDRSPHFYQIFDEETPKTFSSLKRLLLDYLQPSALQLLVSMNDCLRRFFDLSRTASASASSGDRRSRIEPTILRASQSSDIDPDDSPRLARRVSTHTNSSEAVSSSEASAAEVLDAPAPVLNCEGSASAQDAPPVQADSDAVAAAQAALSSSNECPSALQSRIVCIIEYKAVVEQHRWTFSLRPSLVPYRWCAHDRIKSHVIGVIKADGCQEYVFSPVTVLPFSRLDSVFTFRSVPMRLEDAKGNTLDTRVLESIKMDTSQPSSSAAIKGSVFRMQGYSIRVRQYFLQLEADALDAANAVWLYLNDAGRL